MGENLLLDINYSEFENKISQYLLDQHNISTQLEIYKQKDNYTLSDGEKTPSIFLTQNMDNIPYGLRTPIVSLEWAEVDGNKVSVRRNLFVNDIKTIMSFYEKMENKKIIISKETTDIDYSQMQPGEGLSRKIKKY